MSLVPQGAFSLSLFRACRGGGRAGAIPKGSSGRFLLQEAQGCFTGQPCRGLSSSPGSAATPSTPMLLVSRVAPDSWSCSAGSVLLYPYFPAWFQLPHPERRPWQGGETEARSGSRMPAEADGFRAFVHHQAFMLRLLPQLSWGTGQFHRHQGSLSCKR